MKKNNLLHICFLIIILFSNCTYKRSIHKEIDLNRATESATNMLNKLNYNYSYIQTSNSNLERKIEYSLFFKGDGEIHINSTNGKSKIDIISGESSQEARILKRALTQEIDNDFSLNKGDVGRKPYLAFYSLTLLSPGVGIFYAYHNNPMLTALSKWILSIEYLAVDVYTVWAFLQPNYRQDRVLLVASIERAFFLLLGTFWIRNYNDVVDSGYDVYDIHYSFNPIKNKNHN